MPENTGLFALFLIGSTIRCTKTMITHYDFHDLCCIFPRCSYEELQLPL